MISMYAASIPVFVRMFDNLNVILEKGSAHAEARKIDPSVLINYRLAPDMYPLSRQVQIATDIAKGCAARLAGVEPPRFEDNETSFAELKARVDKTVGFLRGFTAAQIDGTEDRDISLKVGGRELAFKGLPYLLYFATPNVYFHITTAYAILRHAGVELGKMDFLGKP
jgi:uncharacterized protein